MSSLKIDDLSMNEELDRQAMAEVTGGARRAIGQSAFEGAGSIAAASRLRERFSRLGGRLSIGSLVARSEK